MSPPRKADFLPDSLEPDPMEPSVYAVGSRLQAGYQASSPSDKRHASTKGLGWLL
jgi:hypothetical protein